MGLPPSLQRVKVFFYLLFLIFFIFKGTKFCKKVVFGSLSYPIPDRNNDDSHSHMWTVYFKPFYDEVFLFSYSQLIRIFQNLFEKFNLHYMKVILNLLEVLLKYFTNSFRSY